MTDRPSGLSCQQRKSRLLEVAVQHTLQRLAVTGLIAGHLVDGVVDGIQAVLLGAGGQIELALGCAVLAVRGSVLSGHKTTPKGAIHSFCTRRVAGVYNIHWWQF